jgi:hypothetical protein
MARTATDRNHETLIRILEEMLEADLNITAQAVVQRHPDLASASAITRHAGRRALLTTYIEKQRRLRVWAQRTQKTSKQNLTAKLAQQEGLIEDLQDQVRCLVESHLHLMSLVAESGGMRRLRTFYEQQRSLRARLAMSRALPPELSDDAE